MTTLQPLYFDFRSYPIETHWSPESNGYFAVITDIPQVAAFGLTAAAAAEEVQKALRGWMQQQKLLGNGELIPYPSRSRFAEAVRPQRRA